MVNAKRYARQNNKPKKGRPLKKLACPACDWMLFDTVKVSNIDNPDKVKTRMVCKRCFYSVTSSSEKSCRQKLNKEHKEATTNSNPRPRRYFNLY